MKKLIVLIILLATVSAYAYQAYLVSSAVNGQWRYCKYSDGRVITIESWKVCPMSLE